MCGSKSIDYICDSFEEAKFIVNVTVSSERNVIPLLNLTYLLTYLLHGAESFLRS
jgi:hypothetical protein